MWTARLRSSTVCFLAIEDAGDLQVVALIAEEDAVVLGAEADQRWFDALKLLGIALARGCVAG
jgi:hypothetical protein